jgi:hypothetical protein
MIHVSAHFASSFSRRCAQSLAIYSGRLNCPYSSERNITDIVFYEQHHFCEPGSQTEESKIQAHSDMTSPMLLEILDHRSRQMMIETVSPPFNHYKGCQIKSFRKNIKFTVYFHVSSRNPLPELYAFRLVSSPAGQRPRF